MFVHELKLRPPQLLPAWLERREMLSRLAAHTGVVSIVAGPGYGKTVLAAQLFAQHRGVKLWYSLDGGDVDLAVFAAHFDALLRSAGRAPRLEGEAWRLGSVKEIGSIFAAALADLPAPLLVFDDVHVLEHSRSLDVLQELVARVTTLGATVAVAGRSMPLPLHAYAVRGRLLRAAAADLAFTETESREYLERTAPGAQSDGEFEELVRRAEGWPAGLTLIASKGLLVARSSARALRSDSEEARQLLFEYLAAEVLQTLSERERAFLLETSLLGELEEAACADVTGYADAGRLLRSFAARGLFIARRADDAFTAHRLFREFLRQELAASYEREDIAELHRRAAQSYTRRGDRVAAIEHLLAAGDLAQAVAELEATVFGLLATGLVSRVRAFLSEIGPKGSAANPALLAAQGRLAQLRGDWDDALATLERAMQLALDRADYAIVAEAVRAISPILAARGEFARLDRLLVESVSLPLPEAGRMALLLTQGAVYVETERYGEALELFEELMPSVVARGDLALQGMVLHNTGAAHVRRGEPRAGITCYERALKVKRNAGQRVSALVTLANQIHVLLLLGETDAAHALVSELLDDATDLDSATILAHGYESLGSIELLRGNAAGALDAFRRARDACDPGDVLVLPYVLHGIARALCAQNEPARADELCAQALVPMRALGRPQPLAAVVLTRAHCAFASAQYERTLELAEEALGLARRGEDGVVEASVELDAAALLVRIADACAHAKVAERASTRARSAAEAALALIEQRDYRFLFHTKADAFATLAERLARWQCDSARVNLRDGAQAPSPAAFKVELLGALRVFVCGEAVPAKAWTRRKAREVFAHLVLARGRLVPRARLIDRHWPDTEADTAHDLLRVTISSVRKAVGDVIRYEDGGYRFAAPEGTTVDSELFERALEAGRAAHARGDEDAAVRAFAEAAGLYTGDLLEGADEASWLERERERLRSAYVEALRFLVRHESHGSQRHNVFVDRLLEEVPWDVEAVKLRLAAMMRQLRTREAALEYERWQAAYRLTTGADAPHIWTPAAAVQAAGVAPGISAS